MTNLFPNNRLYVDIVTSGPWPQEYSIIHLTSWPVTPIPFKEKAFTTIIQPYKEVSDSLLDTDYWWACRNTSPIFREADTLYNAWMSYMNYLQDLYNEATDIKIINKSGLNLGDFFQFLFNMYEDYCKMTTASDNKWPFGEKYE